MIDLLTVNYRNYELLHFQLDHLSKLDGIKEHRLIVVENTPIHERIPINHDLITEVIYTSGKPDFDGISHGSAIDLGLNSVINDVVFIFDTDFFILKQDFFPFFIDKMKNEGYDAIGPEFFDGKDWKPFRLNSPEMFDGVPIAWGTFFKTEIAKSASWTISYDDVRKNANTGFVEVGWKHRKKLLERGKNTIAFDGYQKGYTGQGNCFFRYGDEEVAFHYMRASYERIAGSVNEIKNMIA